ncbi:MAG TPA: Rid family hydrolase [Acidimicrobiales bacterium]|nr:Rid family hydrolase [Acidimicrobiales bacterium]
MARPIGPYQPIVEAGGWLAVSGQLGIAQGALVPGGVAAQTRQAIANLAALLAEHGAGLADIVKTTVFMADISAFQDMNAAYEEAFGDHRPARAAVGVAGLPLGALVEIEAWAFRPPP